MAMQIAVEHVSRYGYVEEATYSIQALRLTPSKFSGQRVVRWTIESRPESRMIASRDGFGNVVHVMTVTARHREIEIKAEGVVDVEDRHGVVQGILEPVPLRIFLRRTPLTTPSPAIADLAISHDATERIPFLHDLMARIGEEVEYLPGTTSVATTAAESLAAGKGVCQDLAHIFISSAREASIPARYVTGYLLLEGEEQARAHHAWAEAWVDGVGWIGFDVANQTCPTDRYVRMAAGLDAQFAAPIRGSRRGGGGESLEVTVRVAQEIAQQQTMGQQ
jgi:transglutaminase-like putative cysteine protease